MLHNEEQKASTSSGFYLDLLCSWKRYCTNNKIPYV